LETYGGGSHCIGGVWERKEVDILRQEVVIEVVGKFDVAYETNFASVGGRR
jgi:hypothetical protein